ncbi:uncharacterized protein LOC118227506 [Anguilla anguilla]|uniref:uncharacterized protein LOC118227506 n=1 Tax=Anguilla anguilla TaxID=7936 RepID=UPI0015ADA3A2|nr:uncharacterized protein LOC118227506 [Anguilla anguilla]
MINFKAGLHFIIFFFLSGLCSVETEVKTVSKKEGETISLHSHLTGEQTSPHIIWLFYTGSSKKIIAQLNRGEFASNYSERFRDRLQLDRQTWSLAISNLNSKDTGVYSIQTITNVEITELKLNLIVYSPVPKPVITHITPRYSVRRSVSSAVCRKSCSVLCSVRNEREVILSWQKEGETLLNTSSPDLNSTLSLPLETEDCSAAYTCVAENPVSNQTVLLNTEELCPLSPDSSKTRSYILPAVMISVVVIAVIGAVTGLVFFIVKQLKYKKLDHTGNWNVDRVRNEVQYANICTEMHSKKTQLLGGDTDRLESETKTKIVYKLCLLSLEPEVKTVSKKEGETVSLHSHLTGEQTSPQILWSFYTDSSKNIIAQLISGEFASDYSNTFEDRLQLDRQTWSLNISNLNSKDTGVYSIQTIINGKISDQNLNLIVYSPVPKPVITHITPRHSVRRSVSSAVCRKSCSVLCSVKNEREVVLSWQREGETLYSTSSPDLNSTLSLPLETENCSAAYTCVAENPVSNQTVPLNSEELCPLSSDSSKTRNYILPAVLIPVVVIAVIGVTGLVVFIVKQLKYKKLDHTGIRNVDRVRNEVQYANVCTEMHSKKTQLLGGDTDRLDSETKTKIVYKLCLTPEWHWERHRQFTVEPEVKTVSKKEGETIILPSYLTGEQTSPRIQWIFHSGSSKKMIAELNDGKFVSDYSERFRDRLQLDRQTWSLNISNLNSKDIGVYSIQTIINGEISEQKLNLVVYSPVPKPVITHITPRYSVSRSVSSAVCRKSCSVLCSVRNEREVVLSWQKEGETLLNTSSPDLNSTLSLPLETENCSAAYTCVAENPVSNQTVPLNTEELCPLSSDSIKTRNYILTAVLIPVVVIVVIACVGFIIKNQKSKELENTGNRDVSRESGELQYADVCIGTHPEETQCSGGVPRALDPEREDGVVYADVRK